MNIIVKKHNDGHYFDLDDFKELIDISKAKYYTLDKLDNGALAVAFYDKDKECTK